MSVIDEALKANERYARNHQARAVSPPGVRLAVVICMHSRTFDLAELLGLRHAEMDVIKTRGAAVSDEILSELVVSTRVLEAPEILIISHRLCDFGGLAEHDQSGHPSGGVWEGHPPQRLDIEENVRQQVLKVRSCPLIPDTVAVRGVILDIETGRLSEVI